MNFARYLKNSQSGAILPILIVILLIIGIAVGTNLIQVPQIFKSRAYESGKVSFSECEQARKDQANGRTNALDTAGNCDDPETTDDMQACTYAGWTSYLQMKREINTYSDRCDVFRAYNDKHRGDLESLKDASGNGSSGAGTGGTTSTTSTIGNGGSSPTGEDLRRCNEAIQKNMNIGRETSNNDSTQVGICTWDGWKSYADLKAYMEEQGWTGEYGSSTSYRQLLDAFWGQKDNKGQCVARVQEEYRKTGAAASLDPWGQHKFVALGNSVNLGALNDKGRGNFSLDQVEIFLTGPDGVTRNVRTDPNFSQTAKGVYAYTPKQVGHYKLVASGESSNHIRCAVEASFDVSGTCASSCSQCIVQNLQGGLQTVLRDGGADEWKDIERGTSCINYDRMVEKWRNDIIRQSGFVPTECANACSSAANNPQSIPSNPTNVSVSCLSDTKARMTWGKVAGGGYNVRLDNTTKGAWESCNEEKGDFCKDLRSWETNAESAEFTVVRGENYDAWVHAFNSKGSSVNPPHIRFSCPGGVVNNPQQSSTPPTTSLSQSSGGSPGTRGQSLGFAATTSIGSGKNVKNASVYVAKRLGSGTSAFPGRVSRNSCNSSSVPQDVKGFNCQNDKNSNFDDRCVWCRIGYTTSSGQFTASFTPDAAGEYDIITSVEDSSFQVGDQSSNGLCSSNPYVPYSPTYKDGYGQFSSCGSALRVTVR